MVDFVLRAALAIAAGMSLVACYEPRFADCADTCGTSRLCPEGLSCQDGFCRVEGAAGSCELEGVDAGTNPMPDGPPMGACPPVPMQQGCTLAGPQPVMPYCHVACAAKTGTMALAFTAGTWHPAVIGDATEQGAALAAANGQPAWIGLTQPAGQATPMAMWRWSTGMPVAFAAWGPQQPDDGNMAEDNAEQCGILGGNGWADEPCTNSRVFLIEPF